GNALVVVGFTAPLPGGRTSGAPRLGYLQRALPRDAWNAQAAGLDTASGQPWCLGRRPSYSGQPATGVQVQVRAVTTTAGLLGVMATNPMSRIGGSGPENTPPPPPATAPTGRRKAAGRAAP